MLNAPLLARLQAATIICGSLALGNAHAEAWVVTDSAHPLIIPPGVEIRVILLDDQERLENQLSRNLPPSPQQAAIAAQRMVKSPEGVRLMEELAKVQQGLTDVWSAGVEKIPAVVVDRKYVVYGQPDVANALKVIERSRGQQ
ncbi:TIGR03757 family integrating conjugative element protein [Pseudomonas protegens]|jgi:integrating conjugative element protein (TIGR03757 family)|uniref:Integrating conjugative element protein, PFL_4709 family n=2 Tax=Pseudomonas protegens TaxID=380021 RepID=Q4K7J1_PSEF5|nr:TIGR03757 family integrating conjugative element protein [Pseudomonas protegens]AAY96291.1 integrating conjugative element protein, PFL_4709 family [Pseudomonas protegens Pf-5]ASE21882.1 TIGR03757 family integrating conjugative element protein [Pseudomonas protegens]OBZ20212.1 integrating conjugative element protein [Pseudomonas protegens]OBZ21315.1 integrating conjugative element protein [Pseudomonas protegens]OKK40586.1 integrating conjugative element protein [Pseudomonas protegens]